MGAVPATTGGRRADRSRVAFDAALLAVLAVFAAPLLWLVLAAFDATAGVQLKAPSPTLDNFVQALAPGPLRGLLNSLLLATVATALATLAAFPAAWVLARRAVPLKDLALVLVLFLSGVPITVLILPIYDVFAKLQLLSLLPAAVVLAVLNIPFELYMMKTAIEAIPRDLEDAARVERARTGTVLARIVIPLALPSIVAAAIYGFINAWGNFLVPLILITDTASQPGPIVIYSFMGSVQVDYGAIAAYSILYSLPIVLFFLFCSSMFRSGYILGGGIVADDRERFWRQRFVERPAVYLDRTSAVPGDEVRVHASAGTAARLVVERVGARRERVLSLALGHVARQDLDPAADRNGCGWPAVGAFTIGADWRPGYYDVVLAGDGVAPTHSFVCVRRAPAARPSPLLLVLATNTLQSYNWWGGANAYADVTGLMAGADLPTAMAGAIGRLSHRRPYVQTLLAPAAPAPRMANQRRRGPGERSWSEGITSDLGGEPSPYDNSAGFLGRWEHAFVAWCEAKGYALDFATDLDLDEQPALLEPYRAIAVVGHSEYWSGRQRAAVDGFVDAGGRFAVFSGNTCYWKVRHEDEGRTLVNHKWRGETDDPLFRTPGRERDATHLWSHPAFANPEARLTGLSFIFGGYHRVGLCLARGAGGYTLWRDDHWSLAGTDLRYGDVFGDVGVAVGYECDGCRFVIGEDGLPEAVPVAGVPSGLEILATAPCTLAELPHPEFPAIIAPESLAELAAIASGASGPREIGRLLRGHAVMASFRRGRGEVFNGGSTEWAHGLAHGDPFIDRITRNVLDRFTR